MTEPKHRPNGASNHREIVSLREYLEARLDDMNKAVTLASDNLKARLDALNEWRLQNKDERATFLTRDTYEARHEVLVSKIGELEKFRSAVDAKASQTSVYVAYILSAVGIIFALIDFAMHTR
jgi:hypothetical protein